MKVLLDIQTELSLPEGGCGVEPLVRRAAALGFRGLAVADRDTLAAGPSLLRAAAGTGVEVRLGLRRRAEGAPGLDLLIFPRVTSAWPAMARLRDAEEVGPKDLADAGGEDALKVLAVFRPHLTLVGAQADRALPVLRAMRAVLGRELALAVVSEQRAMPAGLGRDLDLPLVLAPRVNNVEIEEAMLHRILVLIRGDHEGGGATPRPGRPARAPESLIEAHAALTVVPEEHPARLAAVEFFSELAPADALLHPAPGGTPVAEEEAEVEALAFRLQAACAARRAIAPADELRAELKALARHGALAGTRHLLELHRSLGERPRLGVAPGFAESWVGFGLGLCERPPSGNGIPPSWLLDADGVSTLPAAELEMGEEGARVALGLLDIGGARPPLRIRRLTAAEAARWLALSQGFDARGTRRIMATAEGRDDMRERLPSGARTLLTHAGRLAGRIVALVPASDTRVYSPFPAPHRTLDRLEDEATLGGGFAVRITSDPGLSLLERIGASRTRLAAAAAGERVETDELVSLLSGPLHRRSAAQLAGELRQRRTATVADLARALVRTRRSASAPAPRLAITPPALRGDDPDTHPRDILFLEDAVVELRGLGIGAANARELVELAARGRGAPLAALRPLLERDLAERNQALAPAADSGRQPLDALIAGLLRLAPHLVPEAAWLGRAQALALLGEIAAREPARVAAAVVDLEPERLTATGTWARERGVAFLAPDMNLSHADSVVERDRNGTTLVRLGLRHLPGLDRTAAEVVVHVRGEAPFESRVDLVRRLRHRIPNAALRRLLGDVAPLRELPPAPLDLVAPRDTHLHDGHAVRPMITDAGDRMQYDLFSHSGARAPRIYTAALSRFGIVAIDRAAAAPSGSQLRTAGILRALNSLVARSGRKLAAARLEDRGHGLELLLPAALLGGSSEPMVGRPVVVDGRVSEREGRSVLVVEQVIPLELLAQVTLPGIEIRLPAGYRRVRALRLRILQSPGRAPLHVRAPGGDSNLKEWAERLSRLAVTPDEPLLFDLQHLVGEENVSSLGSRSLPAPGNRPELPEPARTAGAA